MKTTKEALDYLFEEYQKYAPTKMVEGIECFSKEGADWLDSIVIVKRTLEAYQKIEEELQEYRKADLKVCGGSLLTCKQDFSELWKEHKALEIIKNKIVLIDVLFDTDTLEDYNDFKSKKEQLTQEEYDLLREVML